jgi:hypothetical protein
MKREGFAANIAKLPELQKAATGGLAMDRRAR